MQANAFDQGLYSTQKLARNSMENLRQNRKGGIMKNEMPSLFLDEKICFIGSPPNTFQNF
jgi:hypothetical protein